MPSLITLSTDFGTADGTVAALKGVLLSRAPGATLVDLSHDLPPFDRLAAHLHLRACLSQFPPRTVHLVVVDPGVGSPRRGLVVKALDQWLVGPDNGIFGGIPNAEFHAIKDKLFVGAAPTFHGRDVFAPVAAGLASGRMLESTADPISDPVRLGIPRAHMQGNLIRGEIIHVDHYGNLVSNVAEKIVGKEAQIAVSVGGKAVPFAKTYADKGVGESLAYWGSGGLLEIGVREGDARGRFGGKGLPVEVIKFF